MDRSDTCLRPGRSHNDWRIKTRTLYMLSTYIINMISSQLCRECGELCDTDSCIFENYTHATHPNTKTLGHQVRTKNMPCMYHQQECPNTTTQQELERKDCSSDNMCTEENPCYAQYAVHKRFVRLENDRKAIENMKKGFKKFVHYGAKHVYLKFLDVVLSVVDSSRDPLVLTDLEKITFMDLCLSYKGIMPTSTTLNENAGYYGIEVLQKIRDILTANVREVSKTIQPQNDILEKIRKAVALEPEHLYQLLQMDYTLETRRLVDVIRLVNYTVWYTNFSSIYPEIKCSGCNIKKREKNPCRGICSVTNTLTPDGKAKLVMTTCGRMGKMPGVFCECHSSQSLEKQTKKKKIKPREVSNWKMFTWKSVPHDEKYMYDEKPIIGCTKSCEIFELDTPIWSELRLRHCLKHDYHLMNRADRTLHGPSLERSPKDNTITAMTFTVGI